MRMTSDDYGPEKNDRDGNRRRDPWFWGFAALIGAAFVTALIVLLIIG